MTRLVTLTLIALAALGAGSAAPARLPAQAASQTLHACYVPSGTVYRIKEPGLPQQCAGPSHVEFSWEVLGDGSIGTAKLADGAVTSPKIADGGVTGADLANGSVTRAKLAPDVPLPVAVGAVNADGTCGARTANITSCSRLDAASSTYMITIGGVSYSPARHVTVVTPVHPIESTSSATVIATTDGPGWAGGKLLVRLLDARTGTAALRSFHFVVYEP